MAWALDRFERARRERSQRQPPTRTAVSRSVMTIGTFRRPDPHLERCHDRRSIFPGTLRKNSRPAAANRLPEPPRNCRAVPAVQQTPEPATQAGRSRALQIHTASRTSSAAAHGRTPPARSVQTDETRPKTPDAKVFAARGCVSANSRSTTRSCYALPQERAGGAAAVSAACLRPLRAPARGERSADCRGVHHHGVAIARRSWRWEQGAVPVLASAVLPRSADPTAAPYDAGTQPHSSITSATPGSALREANSAYARATSSGDRRQALPIPNNVSLSQSADGPRRPNRSTTSQTSAGDTSAAS